VSSPDDRNDAGGQNANFGHYGPLANPPLDSPLDLVIVIAIAAASFVWSVRAGGPTEELAEILAAQEKATASVAEKPRVVVSAR
jgi:hypothetical protein